MFGRREWGTGKGKGHVVLPHWDLMAADMIGRVSYQQQDSP